MIRMQIVLPLVLLLVNYGQARTRQGGDPGSPPAFVKYDQRQEGDWNVRADLENFVILVIPSSPTTSVATSPSMAGTLSLLDLLTKAVPLRGNKRKYHGNKRFHHHHQLQQEVPLDTQQFIESKTAPYHVDISRSKSNLAKLHPEIAAGGLGDDVLVAQSPKVSLLKAEAGDLPVIYPGGFQGRISRAFLVSVPLETEEAKPRLVEYEPMKKKADGKKTTEVVKEKEKGKIGHQKLALIGESIEQCGPGQDRDVLGICRTIPN